MDKKDYLSVSEAAEYLGVSYVTVIAYCKKGLISCNHHDVSKRWEISKKSLKSFAESVDSIVILMNLDCRRKEAGTGSPKLRSISEDIFRPLEKEETKTSK